MTHKEIKEIVEQVKYLIKNARLEEAFKSLDSFIKKLNDDKLEREFITLYANYNRQQYKKMQDILEDEKVFNKITLSIVQFLKLIKNFALNKYSEQAYLSPPLTDELKENSLPLLSIEKFKERIQSFPQLSEREQTEFYIAKIKLQSQLFDEAERMMQPVFPRIIFNRIISGEPLLKLEINEIKGLCNNLVYKWHERSIVVSALTISLVNKFNPTKIHLLIDFLSTFEEKVWQRAVVGLVIGLHRYDKRLSAFPDIEIRIKEFQKNSKIKKAILNIIDALERVPHPSVFTKKQLLSLDFLEKPYNWFLPFYTTKHLVKEIATHTHNTM